MVVGETHHLRKHPYGKGTLFWTKWISFSKTGNGFWTSPHRSAMMQVLVSACLFGPSRQLHYVLGRPNRGSTKPNKRKIFGTPVLLSLVIYGFAVNKKKPMEKRPPLHAIKAWTLYHIPQSVTMKHTCSNTSFSCGWDAVFPSSTSHATKANRTTVCDLAMFSQLGHVVDVEMTALAFCLLVVALFLEGCGTWDSRRLWRHDCDGFYFCMFFPVSWFVLLLWNDSVSCSAKSVWGG